MIGVPRPRGAPAGALAGFRPLQPSGFQKTEVFVPVEDDVVQQFDADDCARRLELGGDVDVAGRRFDAAAGMIVGHDDRRSPVGHRIGEDFARMNRAAVEQADGNDADVQDFVGAVDAGAEEVLLLAVGIVPDVGQQIRRGRDLRALRA